MSDDRELVVRLLRGDEAAFDEFVHEYYPRLYRFAYRRLGGREDAALDVVQSTFQKVMPRLAAWRGEAPLFSWMCGFCRFEIAAVWKGQEPRMMEESDDLRAALESLPALQDAPDREYERKEVGRAVRVALDHLPRHYGSALEWKYLTGLSVQDIASRLAMTPKAAESLLTRARQAFRDAFTELAGRMS